MTNTTSDYVDNQAYLVCYKNSRHTRVIMDKLYAADKAVSHNDLVANPQYNADNKQCQPNCIPPTSLRYPVQT